MKLKSVAVNNLKNLKNLEQTWSSDIPVSRESSGHARGTGLSERGVCFQVSCMSSTFKSLLSSFICNSNLFMKNLNDWIEQNRIKKEVNKTEKKVLWRTPHRSTSFSYPDGSYFFTYTSSSTDCMCSVPPPYKHIGFPTSTPDHTHILQ